MMIKTSAALLAFLLPCGAEAGMIHRYRSAAGTSFFSDQELSAGEMKERGLLPFDAGAVPALHAGSGSFPKEPAAPPASAPGPKKRSIFEEGYWKTTLEILKERRRLLPLTADSALEELMIFIRVRIDLLEVAVLTNPGLSSRYAELLQGFWDSAVTEKKKRAATRRNSN